MGRAHEVCKRGEDRLTKKNMGGAGVGEDGGRSDRTVKDKKERDLKRLLLPLDR